LQKYVQYVKLNRYIKLKRKVYMSRFSTLLLWIGALSGGFVKIKETLKPETPMVNEKQV